MTQIDLERQKQAKLYGRIKRRLWLVDQGITLLYAFLWLVTGWSVALRSWLASMVTMIGSLWRGLPQSLAGFSF